MINFLTPLGFDEDNCYFFSETKKTVIKIATASFSKTRMMELAPLEFWQASFPKKSGVDWETAQSYLITESSKAGEYDPNRVSSTGFFRKKNMMPSFNYGDGLISLTPQNEAVEFPLCQVGDHLFSRGELLEKPSKELQLSQDQARQLMDGIDWIAWVNGELDTKLLLGWIFCANIAGALPWRPHIWITGAAGRGKTYVQNKIIGPSLLFKKTMAGKTTEAGLRQKIRNTAPAVIFDEAEIVSKGDIDKVGNLVDFFRIASSESEGAIIKGTAGGKAIDYRPRFCACLASINVGIRTEQDESRFSILEIKRTDGRAFMENAHDKIINLTHGPDYTISFFSRVFFSMNRFFRNHEKIHKILSQKKNARFADHHASLAAGYITLVQDEELKDAQSFCEYNNYFIPQVDMKTASTDDQALTKLLISMTRRGAEETSILNLMQGANLEPHGGESKLLETLGLRIVNDSVLVSVSHSASFFKNTQWEGSHSRALMRIEGAKSTSGRFSGKVFKAISIPIEKVFDSE